MLTIYSNSYEGRQLVLSVREASFDASAGTTTLAWELKSTGGIASRYYVADTAVTIGGQTVYVYDAPYWTETTASGHYPFPITAGSVSGTVTLALGGSTQVEVTLSTRVYVSMTPESYTGNLTVTNLSGGTDPGAGAARITAAGDGVLGKSALVQWTPTDKTHVFLLSYVLSQAGSTVTHRHAIYRPGTTAPYQAQLPLDYALAEAVPNGVARELEITLTTYRRDTWAEEDRVGAPSRAVITVTVPQDEQTRPIITAAATAPSPDLLGGVYIQGKTGIQVTDLAAQGRYGAAVDRWYLRVEGVSTFGPSAPLAQYGQITGHVYVLDSRGYLSEGFPVTVEAIPYTAPKLRPPEGQSRITARRCDEQGTPDDRGTYMTLSARRSYSPVVVAGVQRNFCALSLRWRQGAGEWSRWLEILGQQASGDQVDTGPVLGDLPPEGACQVQLRALDTLAGETVTELSLSGRGIYWHRHGALGSLGFGEEVSESDVFLIGREKTLKILGGLALEGEAAASLLDLAHPVGSFLETVSPEDPGKTLGGAWVQVAGSEAASKWRRTQ